MWMVRINYSGGSRNAEVWGRQVGNIYGLSKRIRFVMKDHEEKREKNAGMNFKDYPSVDGKKKNENQ